MTPAIGADGLHSAEYWLERAAEARQKADGMHDAEAVRTMVRIAEMYERMAQRAEARASGRP
jgi:hypothetical protein